MPFEMSMRYYKGRAFKYDICKRALVCDLQQQLRQMVTYAVDVVHGSPYGFPTAYAKFYSLKLRLVEPLQSPLQVRGSLRLEYSAPISHC